MTEELRLKMMDAALKMVYKALERKPDVEEKRENNG